MAGNTGLLLSSVVAGVVLIADNAIAAFCLGAIERAVGQFEPVFDAVGGLGMPACRPILRLRLLAQHSAGSSISINRRRVAINCSFLGSQANARHYGVR